MPRVPADPSAPSRAAGGTPESARAPARPRRRSPSDPDHRTTRVVLNALDLLEAFGGGEPELGVSAIAARLRLPKNTVFRILATLESRGYVGQNARTERYRLAPGSLRLGLAVLERAGLARRAGPVLDAVAAETGESVRLGVLQGHAAVYVAAGHLPSRAVQVVLPIGAALPLHATAVGTVLLAHEPREVAAILAAGARLPARTPLTVVDPAVLLDRLPVIAREGYAVDDGEYAAEVRCVAAPVRDHSRRVVAAISLSGPASRMTPARVERELLPRLSTAALALSERLGYSADR